MAELAESFASLAILTAITFAVVSVFHVLNWFQGGNKPESSVDGKPAGFSGRPAAAPRRENGSDEKPPARTN